MNALLVHPTVREASLSTGIAESTIYTWLKKPDFKDELDERRLDLLTETKNYLQARLMEATKIILAIMNDKTAPPQTRLNAAETAIRNTLKLIEQTDVLSRLDAIEEMLLNEKER